MRVYSMVRPKQLSLIPDAMARAEKLGYDGTTLLELTVPPTLSAAAGAMLTKDIKMMSGVFVAFPRSPMATAYDAWALNELSGGAFSTGPWLADQGPSDAPLWDGVSAGDPADEGLYQCAQRDLGLLAGRHPAGL